MSKFELEGEGSIMPLFPLRPPASPRPLRLILNPRKSVKSASQLKTEHRERGIGEPSPTFTFLALGQGEEKGLATLGHESSVL
jgi:hypothetical protein